VFSASFTSPFKTTSFIAIAIGATTNAATADDATANHCESTVYSKDAADKVP